MVWTAVQVTAGDPTKASDLNSVQANFEAMAEGDAGAPEIKQAAIAASVISTTELETALQSLTFNGSGAQVIVATGGQYCFNVNTTATSDREVRIFAGIATDDSDLPLVAGSYISGVVPPDSQATPVACSCRYISSSPPFNIGDGDIKTFSFVRVNSNDQILQVSSSSAPPWAYNGPTSIIPDKVKLINKKIKKYVKKINTETPPWLGGDFYKWNNQNDEFVEITQDLKNKDMGIFPHPFILNPGDKVLLIEPTGKIADVLQDIENSGENVSGLIHSSYIDLGSQLNCNAPPGVLAVSAKWKNSKK